MTGFSYVADIPPRSTAQRSRSANAPLSHVIRACTSFFCIPALAIQHRSHVVSNPPLHLPMLTMSNIPTSPGVAAQLISFEHSRRNFPDNCCAVRKRIPVANHRADAFRESWPVLTLQNQGAYKRLGTASFRRTYVVACALFSPSLAHPIPQLPRCPHPRSLRKPKPGVWLARSTRHIPRFSSQLCSMFQVSLSLRIVRASFVDR